MEYIVQCPLRISFFGGGSDYPEWFQSKPSKVLGGAINRYCTLTRFKDGQQKVEWDLENSQGLGSSSALNLAQLKAVETELTERELIQKALQNEKRGGIQDTVLSALGGLQVIRFSKENVYEVEKKISIEKGSVFERQLLLFDTGLKRANRLEESWLKSLKEKEPLMLEMVGMVDEAAALLEQEKWKDLGRLLHKNFELKRALVPSSTNGEIDRLYQNALKAGALGGKLLGAGGGGYLVFLVPEDQQPDFLSKFSHLKRVLFSFAWRGLMSLDAAANVDLTTEGCKLNKVFF